VAKQSASSVVFSGTKEDDVTWPRVVRYLIVGVRVRNHYSSFLHILCVWF